MTIEEALATAQRRVQFSHLGPQQYRTTYWDAKYRAWREGQITGSRSRALREAWECKVEIALELLGVEDAGMLANRAEYDNYPRDWRHVVRELARGGRNAGHP